LKTPALIIFTVTYVLLLALPKIRTYIALGAAALFVILGIMPIEKLPTAIDWNVLMMIAGTMGIVSLFIKSKMPSLLADIIIDKMPNVKWAVIALSIFSGLISAFVDNVATVLMVAPVALTISKKLGISPVPAIIAIAVSSNLQGAATLVGDTTSILLGGHANMNFMDFIFFKGKPGLFWVVEAGALASVFILMFLFRKDKHPIHMTETTKVTDYFPTVLLTGMVALLIAASFIPGRPAMTNGFICTGLFIIGFIRSLIRSKSSGEAREAVKEIDFYTIFLLAGLFVVVGGITEVGLIEDISRIFVSIGGNNVFVTYTLIVWASVLLSAVIDNIPYVATMLPVAAGISGIMGIEPHLLYFGLLIGATLGGNITPIGASANIAGLGILRREGYEVSARQFMRIGIPFTLAAVTTGYLFVWFLWS
jgi:Na+/H+ antiporter NhaD/arsenite permease-like protein